MRSRVRASRQRCFSSSVGLVPTIESLNTCGRKISRSLRRRGLLGTAREAMKRGLVYLKLALSPARRAARRCWEAREAEFDHAHGVDTAGSVSLDTLDEVVGPHRNEGAWYSGVDFVLLREQIATLGIDFPQYTFIDLGCGKGRVLLIAAQFPFRQVRGVEFAPALHAVAEKNIAVYRGPRRCCDVRADLADAAEYPVPDGPLVVFLFNPFRGAVMDRVLANLTRSHQKQPRDIWVVYWNPKEAALFDRHGFTRVADAPEGPALIDWRGYRCIIWRLFSSGSRDTQDFLTLAANPGGQSGQFAPQRRRVGRQQPQRNT